MYNFVTVPTWISTINSCCIHFSLKTVNVCFGLLSSTWYLNSPDMQFIRQQQCKIYWHFLHSIACNKVRELVLTCQQNYSHSIPNWGWNFTTKSLIKSLLMLRIISNFFKILTWAFVGLKMHPRCGPGQYLGKKFQFIMLLFVLNKGSEQPTNKF